MSRGREIVCVQYEGFIVAETDAAIGLSDEIYGDVEFWLPKSQVEEVHYSDATLRGIHKDEEIETIEMPEWLADKNDLEY